MFDSAVVYISTKIIVPVIIRVHAAKRVEADCPSRYNSSSGCPYYSAGRCSRKYGHCSSNRHYSAYCHYCLVPYVPSDFTSTIAGNRHYRGTSTVILLLPLFSSSLLTPRFINCPRLPILRPASNTRIHPWHNNVSCTIWGVCLHYTTRKGSIATTGLGLFTTLVKNTLCTHLSAQALF